MNTNPNNANTNTTADAAALNDEAARTAALANQMGNNVNALREENDRAAVAPTGAVSKAMGGKFARTTKRVLGWTLGVGVVGLIGAYAYSRLRAAGVNVPTGQDVGDAVATAVDAATAG